MHLHCWKLGWCPMLSVHRRAADPCAWLNAHAIVTVLAMMRTLSTRARQLHRSTNGIRLAFLVRCASHEQADFRMWRLEIPHALVWNAPAVICAFVVVHACALLCTCSVSSRTQRTSRERGALRIRRRRAYARWRAHGTNRSYWHNDDASSCILRRHCRCKRT